MQRYMPMTHKPSERADQQPGDDKDDVPEHIQRLFDMPQEQWSVEQWRDLSLYLLGELQSALSSGHRANASHESTLGFAKQLLADNKKGAVHAKRLRVLENGIADGTIKVAVKPPRKPPGRPKSMTVDKAVLYLVAASRFGGKASAATRIAGLKLKGKGLSRGRDRTEFDKKKATAANNMSIAVKLVKAYLTRTHGVGLWLFDAAEELGIDPKLLWASKRKMYSRKS